MRTSEKVRKNWGGGRNGRVKKKNRTVRRLKRGRQGGGEGEERGEAREIKVVGGGECSSCLRVDIAD